MSVDDHVLQLVQHINAKLDTNRDRIDIQFSRNQSELLLISQGIHAMDARLTAAISDIATIKANEERATATLNLVAKMLADIKSKGDVATSEDLDALVAAVAAAKTSDAALAAEVDADAPAPVPGA